MSKRTPSSEELLKLAAGLVTAVRPTLPKETVRFWNDNIGELHRVIDATLRTTTLQTVSKQSKLLQFECTAILAAIEHFDIADLEVDTEASVPISSLGNLKEAFAGLTEENVQERVGKVHNLLRGSLDAPIRAELGEDHEIALGQARAFLEDADRTKRYLFYIRGTSLVVYADWFDVGWSLGANSVKIPVLWVRDRRVVSG